MQLPESISPGNSRIFEPDSNLPWPVAEFTSNLNKSRLRFVSFEVQATWKTTYRDIAQNLNQELAKN
jgi:hypothetical protein